MSKLLRLFFAIELNEELRSALAKTIKQLQAEDWGRYIHWTRPENLHITIRFIGSCESARVPALMEKITETIKDSVPFSLQLGTPHLFPSRAQANVIVLTIYPSAELFKLARIIEFSLIEMGFTPEKRAFVPHLTLGRLSHRAAPVLSADTQLEITQLKVDSIALLHSEELNGKRIYTPLERIELTYAVRPIVTVGAIVIKDKKVLLVKRKHAPNQGLWAIPGGKVLPGETLQQAAEREIKEETGIIIRAKESIYVFDLIEHDEDSKLRLHYVVIDLAADYISGELSAGDDAADARWVSQQELEQLSITKTTRSFLTEKIFYER